MLLIMDQHEILIAAKNQEIDECKRAAEGLQKINGSLQKTIENLTTRLEMCEKSIGLDKERKETLLKETEYQRVTYLWHVHAEDVKCNEVYSNPFSVESLFFQLGIRNDSGNLSVGLYRCRAGKNIYGRLSVGWFQCPDDDNNRWPYLNYVPKFIIRIFILGPKERVEQGYMSCNSLSRYFRLSGRYLRSRPFCIYFQEENPQFRNLFNNDRLQIHCETKPLVEL